MIPGDNEQFGSNPILNHNLKKLINFEENINEQLDYRLIDEEFDPMEKHSLDINEFMGLHKISNIEWQEEGSMSSIRPNSKLSSYFASTCPFWGHC